MPAVDATWASWGSWNSCSQTCGGGVNHCLLWHFVEMTCALFSKLFVIQTQSRSRDCKEAKYGGNTAICTSAEGETQPCNTDTCRKFVLSFFIEICHKMKSSLSCGCKLGRVGVLGQLHQNLWRRGEICQLNCNNISFIVFIMFDVQTQSRSRDCNEAQHGGSSTICTIAETEAQLCNTDGCRKL